MAGRNTLFDRELAISLLDQLISWHSETDPSGGDATADEKQYKANQALFFGQLLLDNLLDWAIYHSIGVDVSGTDLQQRQKGDADAHHFEVSGRDWMPSDPAEAREILASSLLRFGMIPPALRRPLGDALLALNLNEVKPLVEPSRSGRWGGSHSLFQIRKSAIMHVHFLWARGTHNKKQAIDEVALALGASFETLRTWERRWLPDIDTDVKALFAVAKRAGTLQRRLDEDPKFATSDKVADALRQVLLTAYPIQQVAEEYRRALRAARGGHDTVG